MIRIIYNKLNVKVHHWNLSDAHMLDVDHNIGVFSWDSVLAQTSQSSSICGENQRGVNLILLYLVLGAEVVAFGVYLVQVILHLLYFPWEVVNAFVVQIVPKDGFLFLLLVHDEIHVSDDGFQLLLNLMWIKHSFAFPPRGSWPTSWRNPSILWFGCWCCFGPHCQRTIPSSIDISIITIYSLSLLLASASVLSIWLHIRQTGTFPFPSEGRSFPSPSSSCFPSFAPKFLFDKINFTVAT